jgi:hypothetical protein
MNARIGPRSFRFPRRHLWASSLDVTINVGSSAIDEEFREHGLDAIRSENNCRVLGALSEIASITGKRLLDVGSAHGWSIEAAQISGAIVTGIEPNHSVVGSRRLTGAVRSGFFPDALVAHEFFDVITFYDVLEHLPAPAPAAAIRASFAHIAGAGLLSINVPDNRGLAFFAARLVARVGVFGPYERLRQKGLQSPHLWYSNADSLADLGTRSGVKVIRSRHLPSIARAGLWRRALMDRRPSGGSRPQFIALALLAPVYNLSRFSDILYIVPVKSED